MNKIWSKYVALVIFLSLSNTYGWSQITYPDYKEESEKAKISTKISNEYMPVIGVWVWGQRDMEPDGFKKSIDDLASNSPFNLIVPFLRFPDKEVTDDVVYQQVKEASEYAAAKGVLLVPDLDVRSARRAFKAKYPDELQQMLRLKEVELEDKTVTIPSMDLNDHYSGGNITHHIPLEGELLKVYAYKTTTEGIEPKSIVDITEETKILYATKDSVSVQLPALKKGLTHASVLVAFTHLYPDIFGPHLMKFQEGIIKKYKGLPVAGVCKDEFGFPPYYPRFFRQGFYDYWYSVNRAEAYQEKTGRELLPDILLMARKVKGKESERQTAINNFMEMSRYRHRDLEASFYDTTKEVFGPDAAVTVHSTWWPFPDKQEFKKNGLDWWVTKRDWAQTDEVVPYAVRTALSKKWPSPIWYNMYYKEDYSTQMWSSVLAGGRLNYLRYYALYDKERMQGENRIRLLNYITKTPVYSPVAVIFGHANAMNWAGTEHDDVGMALVDSLWHKGFLVDLIPTSEIDNGSLEISPSGKIKYGSQEYEEVILYHPEFEKESTADFFSKAKKGTALYRIGDWTKTFDGKAIEGNDLLPEMMQVAGGISETAEAVINSLKSKNIDPQSPSTEVIDNTFFGLRDFEHASYAPPTTGFAKLIDGTIIKTAGTNSAAGDPINEEFKIRDKTVSVDAIGVVAVRLDEAGKLDAMVAGGFKSFEVDDFKIELNERNDIALWKDENDQWKGVFQSINSEIPQELLKITHNWTQLEAPTPPLKEQ